ncbi:MAG: type I-F CRISPR-associated protein Csy3 [gamma proteobacterium endosymbiont of Lamellibrachia anaximandri]|nr:type I-F CRISPR-associated protein Csy3 [gamma proteobacterium endosymbiont of Lamellibrachia anaximandri]MBL3533668.1 type I-F CRISPR-associated protein Csy3 [gamma proteobacterium endosymbiont of Lamellibrachia anaximandri]MBL3589130.1 type I-F CRISPR-associated protein Csy3 [gamma proteobacterium endosymbiont of Lamellibrachia anaximandri]MBL3619208.1 type I-F CRISPR-associated protein Csy3 [gamma proteobacterium endosymbiont of Lamellibrachia anaximandri]
MAKNELKTASVLAFERKLDPSDAMFCAGRWDDQANAGSWPAIKINEKSVRGTISNRLKTKDQDPAKLDASIQNPNLQTVDFATLPSDADTLQVRFTLRVLGGAGTPSACNNADYQNKLSGTLQQYKDELGFTDLAQRYAYNLANGRFLWRNRMGAEQIEIDIRHLQQGEAINNWKFDATSLSLRSFDAPSEAANALTELADVIKHGLDGDEFVLLEITAYARMGDGQEVYPSQELILDKGDKKGQKSKTLYQVDRVAAMHSQKIGNALRTIDTWYPNPEGEELGPIAVEPYGSVTSQGRAYRQPKQKMDFYSLLDRWVLKDEAPAPEQQHYVMANLIRGGVFGEKD